MAPLKGPRTHPKDLERMRPWRSLYGHGRIPKVVKRKRPWPRVKGHGDPKTRRTNFVGPRRGGICAPSVFPNDSGPGLCVSPGPGRTRCLRHVVRPGREAYKVCALFCAPRAGEHKICAPPRPRIIRKSRGRARFMRRPPGGARAPAWGGAGGFRTNSISK